MFAERPSLDKVFFAGILPHNQNSSMQRESKSNTQCSGNTVARQPMNFLTFVGWNSLPLHFIHNTPILIQWHLISFASLNICYSPGLILIIYWSPVTVMSLEVESEISVKPTYKHCYYHCFQLGPCFFFYFFFFYCNLAIFPLQAQAHFSVGELNKLREMSPSYYITEAAASEWGSC